MGLFDQQEAAERRAHQPLAARMRPQRLDEFVGQQHILGPGCLLRRMLQADRIGSVILYGPPGTGKTTLAEIIARHTQRTFRSLNATALGVKELRDELVQADQRLTRHARRTLLFIDELHRFNKAQQDVLLPDVEQGAVSLIGATTANPFFSLVSPLISRSQIFEFQPLQADDIRTLLERALSDPDRGLGHRGISTDPESLDFLASVCDGDARRALTALEVAALSLPESETHISMQVAQESIQRKAIRYDAQGDEHFDAASALIKSMRGSDPDATMYWLARMLEAGEDPRFLARRIVIAAAEDVGNADPQALMLATAAAQSVEFVGLPEARIALSQAALYVAMAPKSNAALTAIDAALHDVRTQSVLPVPRHLKDSHYRGARRLGHGQGYQYAHDAPDGWVEQDYLGVDRTYFRPGPRGWEAEWSEQLAARRRRKGTSSGNAAPATEPLQTDRAEETGTS